MSDQDVTCTKTCSAKSLYNVQLAALQSGVWWDRFTRAVIMDLSLYSPFADLFTSFRAFFNFPPEGGMQVNVAVRTFRQDRYASSTGLLVMGFEVIFLILIIYYTIWQAMEWYKAGWAYLSSPLAYVDWIIIALLYALIAARVASITLLTGASFNKATLASFVDMAPAAYYGFQVRAGGGPGGATARE